jgi:acyl-CoA thioesterase FadM
VGIRVTKLGNSSVRYEVASFHAGEESAVAQGHFVRVYVVVRRAGRPHCQSLEDIAANHTRLSRKPT